MRQAPGRASPGQDHRDETTTGRRWPEREDGHDRAPFPLLVVVVGLAVMTIAAVLGRNEIQTGARLVDASAGSGDNMVHITTFGPVERPASLALGPDGLVYVVDSALGRVTVFEPDGSIARTLGRAAQSDSPVAGEFLNPFGVTVDGEGHTYVSDLKTGLISIFDPDGRAAGPVVGPDVADIVPGAIRFHDGLLYVADLRGQRILVLNERGEAVRTLSAGTDQPMSYPNGIWVADSGGVLVSDTNNNRVLSFSPDGAEPEALAARFLGPRGLAVDAWGRLYVAETLAHRVSVLEAGAGQSRTLNDTGLGFPVGLATDGQRLYVTDRAARGVQVWQLSEAE